MNLSPNNAARKGINYLYFGAYFGILLLMAASSVFAKENLSGSRIFFFLYAMGQTALETALLIFVAWIVPKRFLSLFIGMTFLFLFIHILDFFLERILDLSVWETIGFVLDESIGNFFYLLDASGVPLWAWFFGFAAIALIPLFGIFLYRISSLATEKKPIPFQFDSFLIAIFSIPVALLFWDIKASNVIHPDSYTAFIQSLPWKFTFLEPKTIHLALQSPLRGAPDEESVQRHIAQDRHTLAHLPNIYLFVMESLRKDIIDPETAPHLHAFGQSAVPILHSLSNANGTHHSWFSLFHSQFPFAWPTLRKKGWAMGSPPLNLLKKWGYQVRVYTSAQLGYYGMEEMMFGKENHLIDSYQTFHHAPPESAADSDAKGLQAIQKDLAENPSLQEGQIFIVFWDGTHFDYSWPKEWAPKFTPFSSDLAYFKAFYSNQKIESIKNRYRNAVHYMDSLFGQFLSALPQKEKAIVIAMGDHGEEFFEHGHLFHNSHLVREQTHVPIYIRFGDQRPTAEIPIASHVDIFPSLIDYLGGEPLPLARGQSILQAEGPSFAITGRFNASRSPYEFFIHNGAIKMIARFSNKKDPLLSDALQIRSIRSAEDKTLTPHQRLKEAWIWDQFGPGIRKL